MRRREPPKPPASAVPVPLWVTNTGAGLRYVSGRSLAGLITTDDLSRDRRKLDAARARWCTENGCYRRPQACVEAYGTTCEHNYRAGRRPEGNEDEHAI